MDVQIVLTIIIFDKLELYKSIIYFFLSVGQSYNLPKN